jgi:predicted HTH transcriptional regulator
MIEKLNIEIILKLINLKYEGEYWDSKEKWYDNKAAMLIDIICMANNLTLDNKDGLLIIGVEDNTYKIKGVENDPNRKTQQNMIDFLKKLSLLVI